MPSQPANFSAGPKLPPQLASPQIPVCGDLAATVNRGVEGSLLPENGPVRM